ncbi:coatomer subunit epsilon [Caerostris darwini]|uniref:Coatomer subunit epsilon n=1 Tax=Caerostris darwini TaxID=1538125 RepID=A0AAV4U1N1_9ARAC|nr:coatomer subunit epsilon [Caerostris darwini]
MANQSTPDQLFEIRNSFYIGNYQHCINEAQNLKHFLNSQVNDPSIQLERDIFMYRAYIAQNKYGVVINDITSSSAPELQHIKMLAVYLNGDTDKTKEVVNSFEKQIQNIDPEDKILPLVAGLVFCLEEIIVDSSFKKFSNILFCLTKKELNSLKEIDEDCTLTQMSQAWVNLQKSGDKLQDAYYTFQELTDKYATTPLLLNSQAAALFALGKFEEAQPVLQEALDKDPNSPDTLANMVVATQHIGKTHEVSKRYLTQLQHSYSNHPFVKDFHNREQEFVRLSKMYAPVASS